MYCAEVGVPKKIDFASVGLAEFSQVDIRQTLFKLTCKPRHANIRQTFLKLTCKDRFAVQIRQLRGRKKAVSPGCLKLGNRSSRIAGYEGTTHSLTNLPTQPHDHLLTHSLTNSFTHSLSHSITHFLTQSFTLLLTHSLARSRTHSLQLAAAPATQQATKGLGEKSRIEKLIIYKRC